MYGNRKNTLLLASRKITRAFHVIFLVLIVASCAHREQAIIGVENPKTAVSDVEGTKNHDVFVITTRAPSEDAARMYSGERGSLDFARVTVTLPPSHVPGTIERPKKLPPNPMTDMTVINPVRFSNANQIIEDINNKIMTDANDERSVMVFVHGYNTTFTDAVLRLGQFVEDSGFKGVPVLFSWASAGKLTDYVYDINSALSARTGLIEASDVLIKTNATAINLVAHSMGNLLTVEAMKQAKLQNRFDSSGKLKNIVLASADIDVDVFAEQMAVFDPADRRFYVLISADDKALAASRFLARGVNRVGDADVSQLDALGVTVIDLTKVSDPGSNNHSKFADSPEVVQVLGGEMLKGDSLHTAPTDQSVLADFYRGLSSLAQSVVSPGD